MLAKLTDHTQYTGHHRHRFDAMGRGRGLKGRDDYCGVGSSKYYSEAGFSKYDVQQSVFGTFFKRR